MWSPETLFQTVNFRLTIWLRKSLISMSGVIYWLVASLWNAQFGHQGATNTENGQFRQFSPPIGQTVHDTYLQPISKLLSSWK